MSRRFDVIRGAVFAALFLFLAAGSASAADGRGYLDLSGGYKSGDFGTPVTTNLLYSIATLGYASPEYDFSVSAPWLRLSDGSTETGPGDVILRGQHLLVPEGSSGLSLDGSVAIKLPTADETKGLGTGEADYGGFLGLHQRFGSYKLSLLGGYILTGDPPGIDYRNIVLYGIGLAKTFVATQVMISFEGRQAVVSGMKNPQEIHAGVFHILNADYAVKASGFVGLNNGGPDSGVEAGIIRWF
jgi:hypothetical protein